jgi:hypothetical protein
VFAVNVRGMFLVTRAAVPLLKRGRNPAIVNTASIVGLRPGPQPLAYAASKAAVVALTKTLAGALGPEIRVNAVAPGWMEGDWMNRMLGENYQRLMERRAKATPLQRCVTADDVAEAMLSLIEHNRFVNGEIVVVDGGFANTTYASGVIHFRPSSRKEPPRQGLGKTRASAGRLPSPRGPCCGDRWRRAVTYEQGSATNSAESARAGIRWIGRPVPEPRHLAYLSRSRRSAIRGDAAPTGPRDQPVRSDRAPSHVPDKHLFRVTRAQFASLRSSTRDWRRRRIVSLDELIHRKDARPVDFARIQSIRPPPRCGCRADHRRAEAIPRTHNDYVYNSKMAGSVTGRNPFFCSTCRSRTPCRSPVPAAGFPLRALAWCPPSTRRRKPSSASSRSTV